jgi:hypothetical protein
MKIRSFTDKERRLIRTTAEGCITFDDAKRHQERLDADPDFDTSFDQLIDTTRMEKFDISADEARVLATHRLFSPDSRRAFVASKTHVFGLGRMMEIYRDGLAYAEVEVFYSMDEALKWLKREEAKHNAM